MNKKKIQKTVMINLMRYKNKLMVKGLIQDKVLSKEEIRKHLSLEMENKMNLIRKEKINLAL
jgi:hypothetical protein